MVSRVEEARDIACQDLQSLYHPVFGFVAGKGKYEAYYPRDVQRMAGAALTRMANLRIPGFLEHCDIALDQMQNLQSQGVNPLWEATDEGLVLHEWRNGFTAPERTVELIAGGWPFYKNEHQEWELRYYGAGDTTPGYISLMAQRARAEEALTSVEQAEVARNRYLEKRIASVRRAYCAQARLADQVGDGLVVSIPQNHQALLHHTERDSSNSYDTEGGQVPKAPFAYFSNNAINLGALRDARWMAMVWGDNDWRKEADARFKAGRAKFIETFWDQKRGLPATLVYGPDRVRTDFVSDEIVDGMYYRLFDRQQAAAVVARYLAGDLLGTHGVLSRSRESTQFFLNGPKAYWNGALWPHRTGIGAEALDIYGYHQEAEMLDQRLVNLILAKGTVELVVENRLGRVYDYKEKDQEVAGRPQLFPIGVLLMRSSEPKVIEFLQARNRSTISAAA